ncbi:MAG TPA: aspartate aminotransferase family protein, partial [Actinomycetota bacterium]
PRADRVTERIVAAAFDRGLLLYSSTGHVDGTDGDLLMLGPPFVISDEEIELVIERTEAAISTIP